MKSDEIKGFMLLIPFLNTQNMMNYGFIKVASAIPSVTVAYCTSNIK